MLEIFEMFEMLDKINDADRLVAMRKMLADYHITGMFWEQWNIAFKGKTAVERERARLKCMIIAQKYSASVPINRKVNRFTTPHGLTGIHISSGAAVGTGCTIYQDVIIGSNTFPDSKSRGFPVIGNNVFLGAGSMVIGNAHIGNNVRIGANCIVTKDVPDNCVVVGSKATVIPHDELLDNKWVPYEKFIKLLEEEQGSQ